MFEKQPPQGELFDFFADITNTSNRRGGIGPVKISYIRSDDRGATWTHPVRVDDMIPMSLILGREGQTPIDVEDVPCPDPADTGDCPIRAGDLIPDVAVHPVTGTLYAVWMDARFDGGLALVDHDSIAFTQSTDGGFTWSTPIKVNKTPTTEPSYDQQAFTPSVHADPSGLVTVTTTTSGTTTPRTQGRWTPTTSPSRASRAWRAAPTRPAGRRPGSPRPRSTSVTPRAHGDTSSATTWGSTTTAPTRSQSSVRRRRPTTRASSSAGCRRSPPQGRCAKVQRADHARGPARSPAPRGARRRTARRAARRW